MIRLEDIPDDVRGDVLRSLRTGGDSLTVSRPMDFSVVFPTEDAALAFCEAVHEDGLILRYEQSDVREERPWDVTVTKDMVPSHEAIGAMEDWLAGHAEPLDGENDGWGCFNQEDMPKS